MFELIQHGVLKDVIYKEDELTSAGTAKIDETCHWPDDLAELREFLTVKTKKKSVSNKTKKINVLEDGYVYQLLDSASRESEIQVYRVNP